MTVVTTSRMRPKIALTTRYGAFMPVDSAESLPDAGFDVVRRGYDLNQVDSHLRRIDAEIAILAADRNAAVDQAVQLAREVEDARARSEKLRGQVRTLAGPPQSVQGMSERMRSMLRLAQDEVDDMLGRAETEVAQRRQEAEQQAAHALAAAREEAAQIRAASREEAAAFLVPAQLEATELAERTVRERARLATDRAAMERGMAADRAAMEQELADEIAEAGRAAEAERSRLWSESEERRARVEEDFAIAMDQRRAEALAAHHAERTAAEQEITEQRAAHDERIRREFAWAESERTRIVTDATRRVTELAGLRDRIADQLAGARSALGRTIGSLEPLNDEMRPRNGHSNGGHANGGHAPDSTQNGSVSDVGEPQAPPADDTPTIRTDPPTLTDLEPHDPPRRSDPRRRTRAWAVRN